MDDNSPYRISHKITDQEYGSCNVYYMKPGGYEPKHYHDGVEVEYVIKGNCKTHKEGQVYVYKKGEVHEVINDSTDELVFVCLTIPPESNKHTIYV